VQKNKLFGPSPTTTLIIEDIAKAPSRWEGDKNFYTVRGPRDNSSLPTMQNKLF